MVLLLSDCVSVMLFAVASANMFSEKYWLFFFTLFSFFLRRVGYFYCVPTTLLLPFDFQQIDFNSISFSSPSQLFFCFSFFGTSESIIIISYANTYTYRRIYKNDCVTIILVHREECIRWSEREREREMQNPDFFLLTHGLWSFGLCSAYTLEVVYK